MTYNASISIPALSSATATKTCDVPAAVRFWWFSTHTHRRATGAVLRNGMATIVATTDWEAPAIAEFASSPFYLFGGGEKLTYECSYLNDGNSPVASGDDYDTDENCVGVGYFFPADHALVCFNDIGPL
jgi:hypothetical protein